MRVIICDTETTRLENPEVIQLAWLEVMLANCQLLCNTPVDLFFKPKEQTSYEACAVHHILPGYLANQPSVDSSAYTDAVTYVKESSYIIGHNIDFDCNALKLEKDSPKRICTLAMARKLIPQLTSHTQTTLMYYFLGMTPNTRDLVMAVHNAKVDIENNFLVLGYLLNLAIEQFGDQFDFSTWEGVYKFSEFARIPDKLTFGKHRGETFEDVLSNDPGWINWYCKQPDTDPYVLEAIKRARQNLK